VFVLIICIAQAEARKRILEVMNKTTMAKHPSKDTLMPSIKREQNKLSRPVEFQQNDGDKSKEQQKQEDESRNALHLAAAIGDTDAVKDLLDGHDGKDLLNAADVNGWTPLHEAIRTGEVGVVK
jgi:hypothetical protein